MTYTAPAGWIEVLGDDPIRPLRTRFHRNKDCPRILNPESLREVWASPTARHDATCAHRTTSPAQPARADRPGGTRLASRRSFCVSPGGTSAPAEHSLLRL